MSITLKYLSKMGLSEVSRDVIPPVAPRAKKKNMPPRSLGCKSLALAFSSFHDKTDEFHKKSNPLHSENS